jgi:hypothetical protein
MDNIQHTVDDVHDAVFGNEKQSGMLEMLSRKLSIKSVRWYVTVFALPVLAGLFAFYQFYIAAPLTYSTKTDVGLIDTRVIKIEEQIKQLPTGVQMKEIMKEALKESRTP